MSRPVGSMGPFLEGYREQEQKMRAEKASRIPVDTDILDLFAETGINSITVLEISSRLMIPPRVAIDLAIQLEARKLVSIKPGKDRAEWVELTERGKLYISKE